LVSPTLLVSSKKVEDELLGSEGLENSREAERRELAELVPLLGYAR
jgi:hypothetical protein